MCLFICLHNTQRGGCQRCKVQSPVSDNYQETAVMKTQSKSNEKFSVDMHRILSKMHTQYENIFKRHLHISIISVPPSTISVPSTSSIANVTHPPDQWSASLQCEALYMAAMFPCKEWPGPTIKTFLFQGLHPGKLTCWTQKWSFGRWFPFQLGDFSVPAVHFQGCADLSLLPFWTVVYFIFSRHTSM